MSPRVILLLLLALPFIHAEDQFRIAGKVVDSVSNQPMRHVRVRLAPYGHADSERFVVTANDGRFEFQVGQGRFTLRAERNGVAAQTYNAHPEKRGFGTSIITGPDQKTDELIFRIYPPAVISGTVLDEAGEPVENALVQLIRSMVVAGRKRTVSFAWRYTDDLGQYRFGNLFGATYYLAVTAKPWYAPPRIVGPPKSPSDPANSGPQPSFLPVFFPNTTDPRTAAPITVKNGEEATANVTLTPAAGYTITVRADGQQRYRLRANLLSDGAQGVDCHRVQDLYSAFAGFDSVPPGHYRLRVESLDTAKPGSDIEPVDISSSDVEVAVHLKAPFTVSGTIRADGPVTKITTRLIASLRDEETGRVYSRNVGEDGSFRIPAVIAGKYRVVLSGVPGTFARSVLLEDKELKGGVVDVASDITKLQIRASSGVGRLKGFVYRDGAAVAGTLVVLAPKVESEDASAYRGYQTDSDGSFDIENIRPGDYKLLYLPEPDFEYANPAALKPYLGSAKDIKIEARGEYEEKLEIH